MKKVVIVGCGPAGIAAALELSKNKDIEIIMIDKGKPIDERGKSGVELTAGWGGSSGYSDNKLVYSMDMSYGGRLQDYVKDLNYFSELMKKTDKIFMRFLDTMDIIKTYGDDPGLIEPLKLKAARLGINLMSATIKHYGTDLGRIIFKNMYDYLIKEGVKIYFNTYVDDFENYNNVNRFVVHSRIFNKDDVEDIDFYCDYLILAPGRSGSKWFSEIAKKRGIETKPGKLDLGVRVETPHYIGKDIDSVLYEPKCVVRLPNDLSTRTFCYCPRGEIAKESIMDNGIEYVTVNGHSNFAEDKKTNNTNFALLVTSEFDQPFNDPITFGRSVVRLANLLGGGEPIVQRLKDIKMGRRSTEKRISEMNLQLSLPEAVPGDLSLCFPAKIFNAIVDSLKILDGFIPGVYGDDVALYGVEAKWYSVSAKLKPTLESTIENIYCVGDGSGCTRSEAQAFMSGLIAAKSILDKGI